MKCRFLLNEKFRQGLVYRLAEWNQLNNQQKELLSGLHDEAEVYGVFEPADSSSELTFKVAYRDVAMLYLHLQHFNKIPHYLIVSGGDHINDTVAQLLLNDIIQIAWEGSYVGGPAALPAVYGANAFTERGLPGFLSDLSFKAIYYAWMLQDTNLRSVAGKLYAFNTVPWDASMKLAFYDTQRIEEFLFSRTDTVWRKSMDQQWYANADAEKSSWLSWARRISGKSSPLHSGGSYKLYISPVINDLPEVFMRFIPVISASKAFSFKVGSSWQGLLRPDKMVAYFHEQEDLFEAASLFETELSGYTSQGVPFSAQLDRSGLLSHGKDPPQADMLDLIEGGSWRTTVTDQLALAILQAKKNQLNWPQSVGFIRAMLLSAGIDSYQWIPVKNNY